MSPWEQTSALKPRVLAQWMGAQENPKADQHLWRDQFHTVSSWAVRDEIGEQHLPLSDLVVPGELS